MVGKCDWLILSVYVVVRAIMGRLRNRSRLNEIEAKACRATEREFTWSVDVVVLFVDAAEGRIRNDDKKLAQKCIREESGPIIVAATKVDLLMSDPELNVDVIERGVNLLSRQDAAK
mmetsp:Transcript_4707/g.7094  ORF Transcript_4707/g.7094 Transcript_4707/m.7094 type:complete len:117 (-) Transcript_4707:167-517(-)